MQFRVPQNIAMEDRIFGPFTVIQSGILLLGGGVAFVVLQTVSIAPFNMYGAGIIALITAVLAIGKFNDQPLYRFIKYIILFIVTPKVRVWHKDNSQAALVKATVGGHKEDQHHAAKHVSRKDIAGLADLIDSRGRKGQLPVARPSAPAPAPTAPGHE